jgi:hypothetical protein
MNTIGTKKIWTIPVESSAIDLDTTDARLFAGTYVEGAIAAHTNGMAASLPLGVAGLIAMSSPDFKEYAASYSISDGLVAFIAMQMAYRAGGLDIQAYYAYLAKHWTEATYIEDALCELKRTCGDLKWDVLSDEFLIKHADLVSITKTTPLMYACAYRKEFAFAILAKGTANVEQVNGLGYTAFMMACDQKPSDVAFAILAMGVAAARPEQVSVDGNTALIFACDRKLSDVALAILAMGVADARPYQANLKGYNAMYYAKKHNLVYVIAALEALQPQ